MLEEKLNCVTAAEPEDQWKQMKNKSHVVNIEILLVLSLTVSTWLCLP